MPKALESAFIQQLQDAANQGHVVIIPAPVKPQYAEHTTPLLRTRSGAALATALCLLFALSRSEAQMLAKLMAVDYCTEDELLVAANCGGQKIRPSSLRVIVSGLRKKLEPYSVEIIKLRKLGYGLSGGSRENVCQQLADYDALIAQQVAPKRRTARSSQLELE